VYFSLLSLLLFAACGRKSDLPHAGDDLAALKAEFVDSLYNNPLYLQEKLTLLLQDSTDSNRYYELLDMYAKTWGVGGEVVKAREIFYRVMEHASACDDPLLLLETCNNIAVTYALANDTDSALLWLLKAEDQVKYLPEMEEIDVFLMNIADLYNHRQDFLQGVRYYQKALVASDSLGKPEEERFSIYTGLGHTYLELRNFERSDYYYQKAAPLLDKVSLVDQATYLNNRGNHYYFKGEYRQAVEYMQRKEALLADKPEMKYDINIGRLNLADGYLQLVLTDSCRAMLDACREYFIELQHPTALPYPEQASVRREQAQRTFPGRM